MNKYSKHIFTEVEVASFAGPLKRYTTKRLLKKVDNPLADVLNSWRAAIKKDYRPNLPTYLFLSEDVLTLIDQVYDTPILKWEAAISQRPFILGFTFGDFQAWEVENRIATEIYHRHYRGVSSMREAVMPWGCSSSSNTNWLTDALAARSDKSLSLGGDYLDKNNYNQWLRSVNDILRESFYPASRETSTYAYDVNSLNEFLTQDTFIGTWGQWRADPTLWSPATAVRLKSYTFTFNKDLLLLMNALTFYKTFAINFNEKDNRKLNLLEEQEHATLKEMSQHLIEWQVNGSIEYLRDFIKATKADLAGSEVELIAPAEASEWLTHLFCEAVLRDEVEGVGRGENAWLLRIGLDALCNYSYPSTGHSAFFKAFKEKVSLSGETLTVYELAGLSLGLAYPKLWLRGDTSNYFYLLAELLEKMDGLTIVGIVARLGLEEKPAPNEKEWRAALAAGTLSGTLAPLDWHLPLIVNARTMNNPPHKDLGQYAREALTLLKK